MTVRSRIDRIYESVRKINQVYEIWAASHGLTLYEMEIYYVILKRGGRSITQKELCMELDAPKTSINSMIKKQLQTGYISMQVNQQNRREKMIFLTDRGQAFADSLIRPLLRYEEEAASMLEAAEMEAAIATQNKFADLLLEKVDQKQ